MDLDEVKKTIQNFFQENTVTIVGSGLSLAEGIPGMNSLSSELQLRIPTMIADADDVDKWKKISSDLSSGVGLEQALHNTKPTLGLEEAIRKTTAEYIGDAECLVLQDIMFKQKCLRFSRYISHFNIRNNGLIVITTKWLGEMLCGLLGYCQDRPGIKIIDFSEVPSDVLPVVTGTLARLLYNMQFWMESNKRVPFTIICDEAHLYLPIKDEADAVQKQALYNFERIAKEGRKYGVSILAVSQRPADVSKTILSQCNNFVVLRLTNEKDKSVIKNLLPDSLKSTIEFLPLLDVGEALVVGDSILLPSKILLDKPATTHQPISATKDFWDDWDCKTPNNEAVIKAVEALRRQNRLG